MRENLKALTSLRFVAAAAIVIHHSTWYFGYGSRLAAAFPLDLGVSFFFVLSGFVLSYAHPTLNSIREAANFIAARVARILPAHIAMLLAVIVFLPYPWSTSPTSILSNALLIQSWFPLPTEFFAFNSVSWSISTEMFFYAMFPLLIWYWHKTKWLKLVSAAALAVICVHHASEAGLPPLGTQIQPSIDAAVYIFPPARLFEFVLGMFAADIWSRCRSQLDNRWLATSIQVAMLMIATAILPHAYTWVGALNHQGLISAAASKWLDESGLAPLFAIAIIVMALPSGLVARLLSTGPLVLLGEISFSIYMTHQILLRALTFTHNLSGMPMLHQYAAYWVLVIGSSYLLWRFVEKPCRHYIVSRINELWPLDRKKETAPTQGECV